MAAAAPSPVVAAIPVPAMTAVDTRKIVPPVTVTAVDNRKVIPVTAAVVDRKVVIVPAVTAATATATAAADDGDAEHEQMHVLAVDDSNVDRAVIAKILRSSKYCRVTAVDSATRALELLRQLDDDDDDVDMIITDYWMPGMTGYDLLRRVKESSRLRTIPVVIMSSENVPNRITRCLQDGAEDFLLKPVRPSDVSRLCSRIR